MTNSSIWSVLSLLLVGISGAGCEYCDGTCGDDKDDDVDEWSDENGSGPSATPGATNASTPPSQSATPSTPATQSTPPFGLDAGAGSCAPERDAAAPGCRSHADCATSAVCVEGEYRTRCAVQCDCRAGESCAGGVCLPWSSAGVTPGSDSSRPVCPLVH